MDGTVISGSATTVWSGATLDSRRIQGGEIFFALPGERVDGHRFVAQAAAGGAAAVVVHQDIEPPSTGCACIRVGNTYSALHALTRSIRRQVPEHLVAITGSAGKTTTKELLASMLEANYRVARSLGNLNNLYGFPLSLLNIRDDCQWMVAEMGMSTPGELRQISLLGRPDVALFTNVRPVHLENFDSLRGIAEAKAEVLAGLNPNGTIVANADDPEVMRIAHRHVDHHANAQLITFGLAPAADIRGTAPRPLEGRPGCSFEISVGDEIQGFILTVHGLYNATNCLAAAAVAYVLGVPLSAAAAAARNFSPAHRRGEVHQLPSGAVLIDDVYNSNPAAARLALDSAQHIAGKRHVAVLGDMLELGPQEADYHRQIGEHAALDFELVVGVGPLSRELVAAAENDGATTAWFADAQDASQAIKDLVQPGDVVLLKGSRGIGLEAVVEALQQREEEMA